MKILCDENVPLSFSNNIASKRHKVINVSQEFQGISDDEVFKISMKQKYCIITSDHHFDKFKHTKNFGIIRLAGNLKIMDKRVNYILSKYKLVSLENTYIKVNDNNYKVETNRYHKNKRQKTTYKYL